MFSRIGRLAAPRRTRVILVGLEEHRAAHHRDELAEPSFVEHLLRARHDRAMRAMMADQHFHARAFDFIDERLRFFHSRRDRLFQQRRHAGREADARVLHMQLVRRGEHDAVRAILREQFIERSVERHARFLRDGRRRRRRIDDGAKRARRARLRDAHVRLADIARAGHRDACFG
jgi:hypothetical protein